MVSFLTLYNRLESKLLQIKHNNEEQAQENQTLKHQLKTATTTILELQEQVTSLSEKNKILTITKTVLYKKDKKETEKKINELVREIDHCIALLNRVPWMKES